jgi:hypothetical protein
MNFTFGTDPEFMLRYKEHYCSAIGILPHKDQCLVEHGNRFYYDNVLAECGVTPAATKEELEENLRNCLQSLIRLVEPCEIVFQAAQNYPTAELQHKHAVKVACSLEYCAYKMDEVNAPTEIIEKTPFRTAGGHIHLGATSGPLQDGLSLGFIIKMMDLFIGLPSIFIDKDATTKERRKAYGGAGTHRHPDYGVEYRTLGNFWLTSPTLAKLMFDLSEFVLDFVANERHLRFWSIDEHLVEEEKFAQAYQCYGYDVEAVKNCINTCNKKTGKKFLAFIENFLPGNLVAQLNDAYNLPELDFRKEWGIE